MLTSKQTKELINTLSANNVLTKLEERYAYSFDSLNNPETLGVADTVIFAENIDDVIKIVKFAQKHNTPIICRGAGTNTVGACIPIKGGIVINFSKMNKILDINPINMTATVQPGVIVGDLQKAVENMGLFYPPDPSNLKVSTIGGSIAQNSAGARCFKYGATKDYILALKVVTADGKIIQTGSNTIKNAAGYNLGSLFIGSEGTLGIVVEATLKLIPKPEKTSVIMAYFDTIEDSINVVNKIISEKIFPSTIDFMDKNAINTTEKYCKTGLLCDKESALLIDVDGTTESVESQQNKIYKILEDNNATQIKLSKTQDEYDKIWLSRRSSMAACTQLKPNVTTDDIIVPRQNLAQLVKGIQQICQNHNLVPCLVGHVGDGSIHPQIPINFNDKNEYNEYKLAKSEIYNLTQKLGGIISGEHGIGLEKKDYLIQTTDSEAMNYMRLIKKTLDPHNIMNPYKIF